jgi:uncharacterized membrane protein
MKSKFNANNLIRMKNGPVNYKWGLFYFNPRDTRIIVSKRVKGLGWTLNFANLWSYVILATFIGLALLIGYLTGQ